MGKRDIETIESQIKQLKGKARLMRFTLNHGNIKDETKEHMFRHLINQITKLKL